MSNKVGKTVENRVNWGRWVASSIEVHGENVAVKLKGQMGFDTPDWRRFIEGQGNDLGDLTERLWQKEAELARERADDGEHRTARDEAAARTLEMLSRTRSLLDAGAPGLAKRFGLDGTLPREPKALESFGQNVAAMLREADLDIDAMGLVIASRELANNLQAPIEELRKELTTLNEEERKAERLLTERDALIEEWSRIYQAVAGIMEQLFRLAGDDELARRVRPTTNRSLGIDSPAEDGELTEPTSPAAPEPGDSPEPQPEVAE
ncbi:hypothetical protein EA187_01815 [Lujinxingia sediminis]|uniref:DUF3102 domain-containing protein n=1 Tax=Lujinxingia sediminis TaxID=2480984 RepID=A0ABY0CX60_9DELT|nr:hypothetical protein [Lujinxingia sediminis]RVU48199.1 hypothetical protein EA187_01815 [Lujinxingia sediminis]